MQTCTAASSVAANERCALTCRGRDAARLHAQVTSHSAIAVPRLAALAIVVATRRPIVDSPPVPFHCSALVAKAQQTGNSGSGNSESEPRPAATRERASGPLVTVTAPPTAPEFVRRQPFRAKQGDGPAGTGGPALALATQPFRACREGRVRSWPLPRSRKRDRAARPSAPWPWPVGPVGTRASTAARRRGAISLGTWAAAAAAALPLRRRAKGLGTWVAVAHSRVCRLHEKQGDEARAPTAVTQGLRDAGRGQER